MRLPTRSRWRYLEPEGQPRAIALDGAVRTTNWDQTWWLYRLRDVYRKEGVAHVIRNQLPSPAVIALLSCACRAAPEEQSFNRAGPSRGGLRRRSLPYAWLLSRSRRCFCSYPSQSMYPLCAPRISASPARPPNALARRAGLRA